jgi:hypothetical protein
VDKLKEEHVKQLAEIDSRVKLVEEKFKCAAEQVELLTKQTLLARKEMTRCRRMVDSIYDHRKRVDTYWLNKIDDHLREHPLKHNR